MRSASSTSTATVAVVGRSTTTGRLADYLELTKPRIAVLALVTVTIGYVLGSAGQWQFAPLMQASMHAARALILPKRARSPDGLWIWAMAIATATWQAATHVPTLSACQ